MVTNNGKEEAHDVQITLENLALPARSVLPPGSSHEADATLNITGKAPGKHPLYITVGYADRNGYQFSAILCATYFIIQNTSSDIFGTLKTEPLSGSAEMELQLKNLAAENRNFTLRIFVPKELSSQPTMKTALKSGEEKSLKIPIRNFSALPGSQYPVYAVVEYEKNGRHFTSVILSHIETVPEIGFVRRYRFWLLGAAGIFLLVGIVLLVVRRSS